MASAVLASRNEPYFGEHKGYMKKKLNSKTPNFNYIANPNTNPSSKSPISNSNRQIHDQVANHGRNVDDSRRQSEAVPVAMASIDETATEMADRRIGDCDEIRYVSFDISRYSKRELKQLKRKFVSELEQVRNVMHRIESIPVGKHCYSAGGRESNPVVRASPMPIQILDSPSPKTINRLKPQSGGMAGKKMMKKQSQKKLLGTKQKQPCSPIQNQGSKRNMVDPTVGKMSTIMKKGCNDILGGLMKHQFGWVFNKPVNVAKLGLIDYYRIIKKPMDLGTVKSNLRKGTYGTPLAFAEDVQLTFNNAMLYNTEDQDVHSMAKTMLEMFNSMFSPLSKKFEDVQKMIAAADEKEAHRLGRQQSSRVPSSAPLMDDVRRPDQVVHMQKEKTDPIVDQMTMPAPSHDHAQMQSSLIQAPTPAESLNAKSDSGQLRKPKAKEANKRPLSYAEKEKLGMNLQNLPSEKMEQLVSIIKNRNGHLAQDGDEIELDFELMDNETLWELDRFVSNFYKSMNKMIRQGQENITDNQFVEPEIIDTSTLSESADMMKNKKGEIAAAEEDIDIGEEIPMSQFPPVEIEKDVANASGGESSSSGSSSSDSGSSSSGGSGSASSSGSESDADSVKSPYIELNKTPGA